MNIKSVYFVLVILFLFCSCRKQFENVQVKQIETDFSVILECDTKFSSMRMVRLPVAFSVSNNFVYNRRITGLNYYYDLGNTYIREKDWRIVRNERDFYLINKDSLLLCHRDRYDLKKWELILGISPHKRKIIKPYQTQKYLQYIIHRLDTTQNIQSSFASYLKIMRETKQNTLSVGNLREFSEKHPLLADSLWLGDSLSVSFIGSTNAPGFSHTFPVVVNLDKE